MKRALTVLIIIGLVSSLAISMYLASNAQSTQTMNETPSLESNPEKAGNDATNGYDSARTESGPESEAFSSEQSQSGSEPTLPPSISPEVTPPDGAIYYGGEPPYGYLPTYNPKETGLPIAPLEPDV